MFLECFRMIQARMFLILECSWHVQSVQFVCIQGGSNIFVQVWQTNTVYRFYYNLLVSQHVIIIINRIHYNQLPPLPHHHHHHHHHHLSGSGGACSQCILTLLEGSNSIFGQGKMLKINWSKNLLAEQIKLSK